MRTGANRTGADMRRRLAPPGTAMAASRPGAAVRTAVTRTRMTPRSTWNTRVSCRCHEARRPESRAHVRSRSTWNAGPSPCLVGHAFERRVTAPAQRRVLESSVADARAAHAPGLEQALSQRMRIRVPRGTCSSSPGASGVPVRAAGEQVAAAPRSTWNGEGAAWCFSGTGSRRPRSGHALHGGPPCSTWNAGAVHPPCRHEATGRSGGRGTRLTDAGSWFTRTAHQRVRRHDVCARSVRLSWR